MISDSQGGKWATEFIQPREHFHNQDLSNASRVSKFRRGTKFNMPANSERSLCSLRQSNFGTITNFFHLPLSVEAFAQVQTLENFLLETHQQEAWRVKIRRRLQGLACCRQSQNRAGPNRDRRRRRISSRVTPPPPLQLQKNNARHDQAQSAP
jgi:hypothetical protein